ncbi:MAG TPA: AI-2E family transporter [Flavobacteriia bacterium]|nr:AI-2E family transporter [Flavobacteriia bacterium]
MDKLRTTNLLLLIIALPILFYVLHLLSFIFIPLLFAMFIALLFLPVMRWLLKKKVPKVISLLLVIIIIIGFIAVIFGIIHLSFKEILSANEDIFQKANQKISILIMNIESFFGIHHLSNENNLSRYLNKIDFSKNLGSSIGSIGKIISSLFLTSFFSVVLLAGSVNFEKILNSVLIKQKFTSVKIFMQIENDLLKFIKVKFIISLFTGIGFSLACYYFNVSFPIFWGFLAFSINFIQMIGSIISVILLSLFAFIELDANSTLLLFIFTITMVQVIMGSILEPLFMGKTFSINVLTIVIMLLFWGFIWGIPGMILSIPLTVFIKIILEQFPKTKLLAKLLSGQTN